MRLIEKATKIKISLLENISTKTFFRKTFFKLLGLRTQTQGKVSFFGLNTQRIFKSASDSSKDKLCFKMCFLFYTGN